MILRDIYLYPDLVEFPQELTSTFRYQTRSLCNFLERNVLKRLKFETDGFRRLCIIGTSAPKEGVFVNTAKAACVEVFLDVARYGSLRQQVSVFPIDLVLCRPLPTPLAQRPSAPASRAPV